MPIAKDISLERSRSLLQDQPMGSLAHATAVAHLRRSAPFTTAALRDTVAVQIPPTLKTVYRQAAVQRVVSALMVYFHELASPGRAFVSGEHISNDVALDLLWRLPDGTVEADEIKTGLQASANLPAIQRQCITQCEAGVEEFGESFRGVRAVFIPERVVGWIGAQGNGEFEWL
jgi:hypothetical protein